MLANDPDGDRLAVAVPDPAASGGWRVLSGDQVGALIGSYLLEKTAAGPEAGRRLVVTTVVSSTLLGKIAAAAGARYAETLTGFKWIVRAGQGLPAAASCSGTRRRSGTRWATWCGTRTGSARPSPCCRWPPPPARPASRCSTAGTPWKPTHGVHLTTQVTLHAPSPAGIMGRLRAAPPAALAGQPVTGSEDLAAGSDGAAAAAAGAREPGLPPADVLIYRLPGARVVIRPSGTEPKLKAYLEVVEPATPQTLAAARMAAAERLGPLRRQ